MIAPEHPGYGETEMPEWLDGFDDLVIHYDALLESFGLDRLHLVGYSLGGWIAAELAVFYPRRFASLTLIVPAGLRIPGKPIADLFSMMPDELFGTFFNDPANMGEVLPDFESLEEIEHQFGEAATLARLAWNPRFDPKLERRLERIDCPSLMVRAEHDRLIPDEMAERYAELLPDDACQFPPANCALPLVAAMTSLTSSDTPSASERPVRRTAETDDHEMLATAPRSTYCPIVPLAKKASRGQPCPVR